MARKTKEGHEFYRKKVLSSFEVVPGTVNWEKELSPRSSQSFVTGTKKKSLLSFFDKARTGPARFPCLFNCRFARSSRAVFFFLNLFRTRLSSVCSM